MSEPSDPAQTPPTAAEQTEYSREQLMQLAAYAPHAGFLLVEMSNGAATPEAIDAFEARLASNADPLVSEMLQAGSADTEAQLQELLTKQALIVGALAAAGQLFRHEPGGGDARAEFMRLVGSGSSPEATAAAARVGRILDGKPPAGALWAFGGIVVAMVVVPTLVVMALVYWWLM